MSNLVQIENIDKIFKRGFTTKTRGSGLGLALCAGFIKRGGGKLTLTRNEDGCVRFSMALPIVEVGVHA